MINKVLRYTRRLICVTALPIAVKLFYDLKKNNDENYLIKYFKIKFPNDGKIENTFDFLTFYQDTIQRLQTKSLDIPYFKKTLDIEVIRSEHDTITKAIEKYHSIMKENIDIHEKKIADNKDDEIKLNNNITLIIDRTKSNNKNLIKNLEKSEKHLIEISIGLLELNNKIEKDIEILTAYILNDDFYHHSQINKKLKVLSEEFVENLKSFKLELFEKSADEFGKVEILQKLSEMSKLKERFLKEKLNLIEKQENDYYNLFKNKFSHFESLVQDFKSVANEYKAELLYSFGIKNEIATNSSILDIDIRKTLDTITYEKFIGSKNDLSTSMNEQLYDPAIISLNRIANAVKEILNLSKSKLKLDEDQEFISKFSKSYHSRYLFITKTLQSKLEFDELNKKDLDNFIENNINHKNFSETMGDEFSSKLLAKNPNLTTNKALINEFNDTKNAIIFQIFFKNRSFLSFLFSRLMEKSSFIWFPYFYSEKCNSVTSIDTDSISILKELSFMENLIKEQNYIMAYQKISALNKYAPLTRNLDYSLRERIRYNFVLEHLNNHLNYI